MSDTKKNIAIGFVVSVALFLVIWALLFLHPSFGDQGFVFHARFQNVEKVGKSTRVTYAGRPVGEVKKITPVKRSFDPTKDLYSYDVTIAIDSHVVLYPEDEITLSTSGLMGERYVAILPRKVTKDAAPLKQNGIMYADEPPSMVDIMQDFAKLTRTTSEISEQFAKKKTLEAIVRTIDNLDQITQAINHPDKLNQTIDSIHNAATGLAQLTNKLTDGSGSLGQLIENDDIYLRIDRLLRDMNQYGLLFHLNKQWQREKLQEQNESKIA